MASLVTAKRIYKQARVAAACGNVLQAMHLEYEAYMQARGSTAKKAAIYATAMREECIRHAKHILDRYKSAAFRESAARTMLKLKASPLFETDEYENP